MKTIGTILTLFALPCSLLAQGERGVTPIPNTQSPITNSQTRAVVVGISDYQDPGIPDLRFADRDAEAFANFLRSPAGGALDKDRLQVLINQDATAGRVAAAFDWLLEQSKKGDQAIIYFSGHGDVERKTVSQPGFLLCWDAPERVYMGGGTYSLAFLQEIVLTLSTQNLAKVVVIADACHAGKLAGSQIGGTQLTAANLARQFAGEVKILSCQPGEYSLEGSQWGGGRGCFSYHLVDGLFGLADRNADDIVTVGEIDRYLEDHVTAEAAPQSQVPMLLGNKTERLSTVNAGILADLQKQKYGQTPVFAPVEQRGLEEEILAGVDSNIREMYRAFKLAVREKRFFEPAGNCAEDYYTRLTQVAALTPLYGFMKRNYAAALQDDAQQVLNRMLKSEIKEVRLSKKKRMEKYRLYPRYLERAAELLGERHYMYPVLQARKHFFQGYLLALSNENPDKELGEKVLEQSRLALKWQPDMPNAYAQMGGVFKSQIPQPDSMRYYALQAASLAPSWISPYIFLAHGLITKFPGDHFDEARKYLEKATLIDSTSAIVWNNWGIYYLNRDSLGEAERCYKKAIHLDSTFINAHVNLGAIYRNTSRDRQAIEQYKKAIQLDSTNAFPFNALGFLYLRRQNYTNAEEYFKKAIRVDSTDIEPQVSLGEVYMAINRFSDAEEQFKKTLRLDSINGWVCDHIGYSYYFNKRYAEAEEYYKKALQLNKNIRTAYINLGNIYRETNCLSEAEELLKKYIETFPGAEAYYRLGNLYHWDFKDYAKAEQSYNMAITADSTWAWGYYALGQLHHYSLKAYDVAMNYYLKTLALDSTHMYAPTGLAQLYEKKGEIETSVAILEKALIKRPDFPQYLRELSRYYHKLGKRHEARIFLKNAIEKDSLYNDVSSFFKLVEWYVEDGQLAEADTIYRQMVERYPLDYSEVADASHLLGKKHAFDTAMQKLKEGAKTADDFYTTGRTYAFAGDLEAAVAWLGKALEQGYDNYENIRYDTSFDSIRKAPEFKSLLKKYFPEQIKD